MKKLELICAGIMLLSFIGSLIGIPGTSMTLILSFAILIWLYYPFGVLFFNDIRLREALNFKLWQAVPGRYLAQGFVGGFILCISMGGVVFKWNSWPGAELMLRLGLGLAIVFLMVVMVSNRGRVDDFHKRLFIRFAIIGSLVVVFSLASTLQIVSLRYRDQPEVVKAWQAHLENPDNEALKEELDALLWEDIKKEKRDEDA